MKTTGKTLLKTTAEWTEATHSSLRKFEEDLFYVKNIGTEEKIKLNTNQLYISIVLIQGINELKL